MTVALTAGVAVLMAALYAKTAVGLASEWMSSPDASYGVLLAGVAVAVAWQRRRLFAAAADTQAPAIGGIALLLLGALMYLAGVLGADVFITRISLVPVIAGTVWYLAGRRAARLMLAPIAFLLIAIPPPTLIVNAITLPLQLVASRIAEVSLAAVSVPVFRDGNVLELPSTTLQVAEACSGLRSLVSLLAVGAVLAWSAEHVWWRRGAIILVAVPLAIVANGIRVAVTGVACETWGPRAASGGWHTFTGWVTFVAAVFVLVHLSRAIGTASRTPRGPQLPRMAGV